MLRSDSDRRPVVDPDDIRELLGGIAFLALLGLGLFVNTLLG